MKTLSIVAALLVAASALAGTRDNDDTCDIKVGPAATLLLPYFEVDVTGNSGQTTLFTVTNVTRYPQIAHVTLWTDAAYPVLTFNLFLAGYDVQSINLADVLVRNVVAPPSGTSMSTTSGPLSAPDNANFGAPLDCSGNPGLVPASQMATVRSALTVGAIPGISSCSRIGLLHLHAIGYATIDVVANCTQRMPNDPLYYANDMLFDNVLIGDYQQLGPQPAGESSGSFDATANTMVHIRAIPEGGSAGSNVVTALPYTFYDRYTPATSRTRDRRQPLPSTFAARFIQGGPSGFRTNLHIWREGLGTGSCASAAITRFVPVIETVRFDEHENPMVQSVGVICAPGCSVQQFLLPSTSSKNSRDEDEFPPLTTSDVGGWFYLNLDNGGSSTYSVTHDVGGQPAPTNLSSSLGYPRPSQNWVTVSMFGGLKEEGLTTEFDAASFGNGCSPATFYSIANYGTLPIGPTGGAFVCPPGTKLTNGTTAQCTGTNVNPTP